MTYQWLLFDADGTLFDYDKAESVALKNAFALFELPFSLTDSEIYRRVNAEIWRDFEQGKITASALRLVRFERLFDALDLQVDAAAFSTVYLQQLASRADLVDGALALMEELDGRFQLMLITNGLQDVQRSRLALSPLQTYFADCLISDELGVAKPDSAIFDIAFARMGQPAKNEVLIIGDSLSSDMLGGANYGIDTCWYNPGKRPLPATPPLTYSIQQLADLLPILNL